METKKRPDKKAHDTELSAEKKAQQAKALAQVTLRPSANAAAVIAEYGKSFGNQDVIELVDVLATSMTELNNGDLKRCENMLMGQAYALQAIFMNLSLRSKNQDYLKSTETFLRLALKAQSQCRATLETLAAIKNPPVVFAKQANISNGHQQVNNGIPPTHAGKNNFSPNELLEAHDDSTTLDNRATHATSPENKAMATVE